MLRVKSTFPGQPVQINFEIVYQPVAGRWRLFGLSVRPVQAASAAPAVAAKEAADPNSKAAADKTAAKPKKPEPATKTPAH